MLKLFLWLRYLRKKKIVFLSIAAVALSVALLIVVDSLFTGFIEGLKKADMRGTGDILLVPRLAPKYDILIDELEKIPEVQSASPFLGGGGLLRLEAGDVREVMVVGVDAKRESKGRQIKEWLLRQQGQAGEVSFDVGGHANDIGGWVGINVVAEPNEITDEYDFEEVKKLIGKQVVLTISGRVKIEPKRPGEIVKWQTKRKVIPFRISDIFHSGIYYRDNAVYLPYDEFYRRSFGDEGPARAANVKIELIDGADLEKAKGVVWQTWERFASEELRLEPNDISRAWLWTRGDDENLFYAELQKQMAILLLIFGVICSVAVLLIFCIFYMIVETKQKDIAIIKSCGTSGSSVAMIFFGFGSCIGIVGAGIGIVFGYIVTKNINAIEDWVRVVFGMKLWRSSVYMFEQIPNQVNWAAVWWIVLVAIAGCIIGALIPAIVAARIEPVKILRYE